MYEEAVAPPTPAVSTRTRAQKRDLRSKLRVEATDTPQDRSGNVVWVKRFEQETGEGSLELEFLAWAFVCKGSFRSEGGGNRYGDLVRSKGRAGERQRGITKNSGETTKTVKSKTRTNARRSTADAHG